MLLDRFVEKNADAIEVISDTLCRAKIFWENRLSLHEHKSKT
jgi:hypothetical protein